MDKQAGRRERGKQPPIVKIKGESGDEVSPLRPNWSSLIPSSRPKRPSRPAGIIHLEEKDEEKGP